jgi:trimethylamine--corrinoid protein Co-methyltransferase
MKLREPLRVLSKNEMEQIHEQALKILAKIGIWVESEEAREYYSGVGCQVERAKKIVKIPVRVVEKWLGKMKSDFSKQERVPQQMAVRYSHIRFRKEPFQIHEDFSVNTGGFCTFIYDLEGKKRKANLEDVRKCINLAHHLDEITYLGLPVSAQEIPPQLRPVKMAAELVKRTNKLGGVETFTKQDVHYITEIAEIVAGSKENLRKNPVLVGYGEMRSPLCLDAKMSEIMIEYIKLGLPQSLDTMPCAGTTAPLSAAAVLSLGLAETLAGLVLGYAVDENATMSIDLTPSFADLGSGLYRYFAPERGSLLAARIQMISEFYGCPSGVHGGKTDSCFFNEQTGVDKAISMLYPILCGTCGIGTVGHLENAVTFSPVQLVIDNEIAKYIRFLLREIKVTEESLAFGEIEKIGIGGEHLTSSYTLKHCRENVFYSELFEHLPWERVHQKEHQNMIEKAKQRAKELMEKTPPPMLTPEQEKAIDEVVKKAEVSFALGRIS